MTQVQQHDDAELSRNATRAMNPIMLATEIAWPSPQINQKPPTNAKGKLSRMMDTSLSRRNTIQMTGR